MPMLKLIRGTRSRGMHDKIRGLFTGYLVPKGWKVIAYLRGLHSDPENYAKPEEFDPLRWEVSTLSLRACS